MVCYSTAFIVTCKSIGTDGKLTTGGPREIISGVSKQAVLPVYGKQWCHFQVRKIFFDAVLTFTSRTFWKQQKW
jgi:uncharacterized protein YodC (DUF2158 family)